MKSKMFVLAILLLGMGLSACAQVGNANQDAAAGQAGSGPVDVLDGTSWKLLHYRKTTVSEGIDITAVFENGNIGGSSGCNSYSGTYQIDGSKITIGPLAGTMMACVDPPEVMEMEQMYQAWLTDAVRFELSEDQLMIFRSDGEALTFVPNPQD